MNYLATMWLLHLSVGLCLSVALGSSGYCTSRNRTSTKLCSCDEKVCVTFGDCCEDVLKRNGEVFRKPEKIFECANRFDFESDDDVFNLKLRDFRLGYFMINKCPKKYTGSEAKKAKCESKTGEDWSLKVPVYDVNGVLYKNQYCAFCNSVPQSNILYPNGAIVCVENITVEIYMREKTDLCSMKYRFPKRVLNNLCYRELRSDDDCRSDDRCLTSATRYSQFYCVRWTPAQQNVYRNQFCAICDFNVNSQLRNYSCRVKDLEMLSEAPFGGVEDSGAPAFYKLVDFKSLLKKSEMEKKNSNSNSTKSSNQTICQLSEKEMKVAYILNLAAVTLSILGLIALLIVYSSLSELRNLGGVFVMNLAASLLAALLLFALSVLFSSSLSSIGCSFLAFLKLLFFLSAFCWMLLFGFDLLRAFRRGGAPPRSRSRRSLVTQYSRAASLGYGAPMLWSLAAIITNELGDQNTPLAPQFNIINSCWFGDAAALIFWFFTPVCVSVLVNCVLLAVVIINICRATQQAKMATGSETSFKDTLFLTLKVTAVLGLTWIFVLIIEVATPAEYCWPKILAGLLAALQGFFVACGFLFTKRVTKVLRHSTKSRSSTTTTTSTSCGHTQKTGYSTRYTTET